MATLKRFRILSLLVANMVAFGLLALTRPEVASGFVDACDEDTVPGCDCIRQPTPFLPVGCYDNLGDTHVCTDDYPCV